MPNHKHLNHSNQPNRVKIWQYQLVLCALLCLAWSPRLFHSESGFLASSDDFLNDLKFRWRGTVPASGKVAIVEIDSRSVETLGRWPWRRDYVAVLIDRVFAAGATNVGLDIVFSEQQTVPPQADPILKATFEKYRGKITSAWITEVVCEKPCDNPEAKLPPLSVTLPKGFPLQSLMYFSEPILNIPSLSESLSAQGFANAQRDQDGIIRKAHFFFGSENKVFPSLALSFAAQALGKTPEEAVQTNISPIRYLGPRGTIPSYSAMDILKDSERDVTSDKPDFTGKSVFIGISALAVGDLIATPFDSSMPGVEVQATIAEQILTNQHPRERVQLVLILALVISGLAILLSHSLESTKLFFFFPLVLAMEFFADFQWLFPHGEYWPTTLIYANTGAVFLSTFVGKYYQESQSRKQLRDAFSRYLAPEVVKVLAAHPEALSLGGERKELSVLFCDLRDFTTISESLEPAQLTQLLNEYFTVLTDCVFRQHGTVDKYIGDALMAFFGAPIAQPDHAARAVQCAIEMVSAIEAHQEIFKAKYGVTLRLGVGVHSGIVNVGNMGSEQRLSYTVIGDNVNTASRLEGLTKKYHVPIVVSKNTLELVGPSAKPNHRKLDTIRVKGKANAIEIFEVSNETWKPEGITAFEKARELFTLGMWQEAKAAFEKAQALLGDDGPSQVFISRCEELAANGRPTQWDGTWDFREK